MGAAAAMAVAGGLQATSTLASGFQAYKWGKYENKQAQADANATEGAARVEAGKIRELSQRQKSSARAALAASGVQTDAGTGAEIQSDITQRSEEDALTTILNGKYQGDRVRLQGSIARQQGRDALAGSVLKAAGQATQAYGGWKGQ